MESNIEIKKSQTLHVTRTKDEQKELLTHNDVKKEKDSVTDKGVQPQMAANVSTTKSKNWSLFNKDAEETKQVETQEKNISKYVRITDVEETKQVEPQEMVKSYSFNMKEVYHGSIVVLTNVINELKAVSKSEGMIKELRSAITMIEGIAEKANSPLPTDNVMNRFSTMCNIMSCMVGNAYKSMKNTFDVISTYKAEINENVLKSLEGEINKYMVMSNRISTVSADAVSKGIYRTWGDIFEESMKEKVIDITSQKVDIAGNVMSTVTIVGEGDDQLFYKDDVKVVEGRDAFNITVNKFIKNMDEEVKAFFKTDRTETYRKFYMGYVDECQKRDNKKIENRTFKEFLLTKGFVLGLTENKQKAFIQICEEAIKLNNTICIAKNAEIGLGESFAGRNIAVTKMAQLMGIDNIVVKSQMSSLVSGENKTTGFAMSKAKGTDFTSIPSKYKDNVKTKKSTYTGEFQRQMVILQIFDNIMGQRDRHLNNIFYQIEEKGGEHYFTGITGIDNDMCAGLKSRLNQNDAHAVGVLDDSEKYLVFDCMDKELYQNMKVINEDLIRTTLHGLMGEEYINAIVDRYSTIMKAIENSVKKKNALVEKDEWGDKTLEKLCRHKDQDRNYTNYVQKFVESRNRKK